MKSISTTGPFRAALRVLGVLAIASGMLAMPQPASAAADCYVDGSAGGANNGSSWANAYNDLQDALANVSCLEIWVADGTYLPDGASPGDSTLSFTLQTGVAIYGGFAGGETDLADRDPAVNVAILSGNIGAGGSIDNSYHVVYASGVASSAILDGFTVTAGYADGAVSTQQYGAGIYLTGSAATLNQLLITDNYASVGGAGLYTVSSIVSPPTLTNATFDQNTAGVFGGGLYATSSNISMTNVTITANHAGNDGGGMINFGNGATLTNVTFFDNTASDDGGAMFNSASDSQLTNVTFYQNDATSVADSMYNELFSDPIIVDSIFWEPSDEFYVHTGDSTLSITDSIVQGGCPTGASCTNVIASEPRLGPLQDNGGYTRTMAPASYSPAVDAGGANSTCAGDDQRGVGRPQGAACDLGAVEFQGCYVDDSAAGLNDGSSWTDAYSDLQDALANAFCTEVWIAGGVYKPGAAETDTFVIPPGLIVYGGFAGTESAVSQREEGAHPSVLSGDIDNNDAANPDGIVREDTHISGANSNHVVALNGTTTPITPATVLDGLTITAGQADGMSFPGFVGGGLVCNGSAGGECSPTIRNTAFRGNYSLGNGAAIYNLGYQGISSPVLTRVTFSGNGSDDSGGAIYNAGADGESSPVLTNVTFHGNTAASVGGALYNNGIAGGISSPTLLNVTFTQNSAVAAGGAVANSGSGGTSAPSFTNVILWDDTAPVGAEMQNSTASPTINYSVVEGGNAGISGGTPYSSGIGNVSGNPQLGVLRDNGGFTETVALTKSSLALEIGLGGGSCPTTDQRGISRPRGNGCDRGSYERIPPFSDFDPDVASDPVVFEKATGNWFVVRSALGFFAPALNFGNDASYIPVPGDYDGDTETDPAVFEKATGNWFVVGSTAGFFAPALGFGNNTSYIPVPGDYDGDGATDAAVFEKATGNWFVVGSTDGFFAPALNFGNDTSFIPVQGDYDGDGTTDPAVFEKASGNWFVAGSADGFFTPALGFGNSTSYIPVQGDYDGDGKTDPTVFEKATGNWFAVGSNLGFFTPALGFGNDASYITQPGDYDGDARMDAAVFERATGNWFVVGTSDGFFTPALNFGNDTSYIPVVTRSQ